MIDLNTPPAAPIARWFVHNATGEEYCNRFKNAYDARQDAQRHFCGSLGRFVELSEIAVFNSAADMAEMRRVETIVALGQAWERNPTLRLGELVTNAASGRPLHIDDRAMIRALGSASPSSDSR